MHARRPRVHVDEISEDGPSNGCVQAITDALGRTVEYDYDLAGRVIKQTLPDGREIAYGYDANGNVTEIVLPGQPPHRFDYTPLNTSWVGVAGSQC